MCSRLLVINNVSLWTCPHPPQPLLQSHGPILSNTDPSSRVSNASWLGWSSPSPVQTPSPASHPVQTPSPGSHPVQTPSPGSHPVQTPSPGSHPVQTPSPGSHPVQTPSPGSHPVQTPSPASPSSTPSQSTQPTQPTWVVNSGSTTNTTVANRTEQVLHNSTHSCHCNELPLQALHALHVLWIVPLIFVIALVIGRKLGKHKIEGTPAQLYVVRKSRSWPELPITDRTLTLPIRAQSEPDLEVQSDFHSVMV